MRHATAVARGRSNPFAALKQEYEHQQQEKQAKRAEKEATKQGAMRELEKVVKKLLEDYKQVRAIDQKNYHIEVLVKTNGWSLGHLKDGVGWEALVTINPEFDSEGNIEHLYVSMGKSINVPEPWTICKASEKELITAIVDLHRQQHN
ncbi:MAG: hypothetical protein NZ772_18705 [Cyanobacteria bacterium]|nr:hypothetical protein [Cyanobacteriota bacterium]MDW8200877.1 hypothetical protein [Cyanobacteriota bacterium SKYGB_h_bin112]